MTRTEPGMTTPYVIPDPRSRKRPAIQRRPKPTHTFKADTHVKDTGCRIKSGMTGVMPRAASSPA
jgi:hypothetical protein